MNEVTDEEGGERMGLVITEELSAAVCVFCLFVVKAVGLKSRRL